MGFFKVSRHKKNARRNSTALFKFILVFFLIIAWTASSMPGTFLLSFLSLGVEEALAVMTLKGTLTYDSSKGQGPDMAAVANDIYLIAYQGNPNKLATVRVQSPWGDSNMQVLDTDSFSTDNTNAPRLMRVWSGVFFSIFAVVYTGSGKEGWIKTVSVNHVNGTISNIPLQDKQYDANQGVNPKIIRVSGDIYAIAYQGSSDDGYVKAVSISSLGIINTNLAQGSFEFETNKGRSPDIVYVGNDNYAIVYQSSSDRGRIVTVRISNAGVIQQSLVDGPDQFDSDGLTPRIVMLQGSTDRYAIIYEGRNDRGAIRNVQISNLGVISSIIPAPGSDPYEFESSTNEAFTPDVIYMGGTNYAIVYESKDSAGRITTLSMPVNGGAPTVVDPPIVFDGADGKTPAVRYLAGTIYAVIYEGNGQDGIIKTYDLGLTPPPPTSGNPGMLVYGQDGQSAPRYRLWDGNNLASEQNATSGEGGHNETQFIDIEHSPVYNQKLLVEQTSAGHIRAMVWDGSTWSYGGNAPANGDFAAFAQASATSRAYGVAYEGLSGEALLVYENSGSINKSFGYALWDGINWTTGTYAYDVCDGAGEGGLAPWADDRVQWMKAKGQINGDNILVWFSLIGTRDGYAAIWNGTTNTFTNCTAMTGNVSQTATTPTETFDIAWETNSKDAMVAWGQSTSYNYKTFSGGAWSVGASINVVSTAQNMELASDATSDYIAFIGADLQSPTHDVEVKMWNGANWTSIATPSKLGDWPNPGAEQVNAKRVAVAWERNSDQALFALVKENKRYIDYFVYDRSDNTFTCPETGQVVTDLDSDEGSGGPCNTQSQHEWKADVGPIRFKPDPFSNDIFLMAANDTTLDIRLDILVWRGEVNAFHKPITNSPESDTSPGSFTIPQAHAFDFAFNFGTTLPPFDCGIRYRHSSGTIAIACEPTGILTSPLRIRKSVATYGIILVPTADPKASHIRIRTIGGTMSLKKL